MQQSVKPILVGEAPNRKGTLSRPFAGKGGQRLANALGVSHEELLEKFETVNLLDHWPGEQGKGASFDSREARRAALRIEAVVGNGGPNQFYVLCGKRVAKAFGVQPEYFVLQDLASGFGICIPHPSGVNRLWNSDVVVDHVRKALEFAVAFQEGNNPAPDIINAEDN